MNIKKDFLFAVLPNMRANLAIMLANKYNEHGSYCT